MTRKASRTTVLTVAGCALALAAVGGTSYAAGQITGKQIKDKTLGPNDLLVRVASKQVDDNAIAGFSTGTATALKVQVTAPTKGYVVVTASSDVYDFSAPTYTNCWISLNGHYARGSERSVHITADDQEQNCGTNVTIPVGAGKKTVSFDADGGSNTIYDETTLSAEFIPFNGNGKRPSKSEIKNALSKAAPSKADRSNR
ncbi:MAG: hypothetical protein QM714_17180 [Nocardioides sp.]|uniref:hypothetical protein n=1 Tax=Nocardioides sp. TaxID=35761 RepID=UPI0039E502E1